MKMLTLATALLALSTQAMADDPMRGSLVLTNVNAVYVPNGFDDNDEVVVVLEGYLPNTCHKIARTDVKKDPETGAYVVYQWARKFDGMMCLQILTPFTTEAHLGAVDAGEHRIETLGTQPETFTVKAATNPGPDDYLYAPIDAARVETDPATGARWAIIEGRFTNTCMKWDDIKVIDSGRTVEVLPIVAVETKEDCRAVELPFSYRVDLPASLAAGRHLLHVRSLNGKAVNVVFAVAR